MEPRGKEIKRYRRIMIHLDAEIDEKDIWDSGYPLLPYAMTPKLHEPEGSLAARYAQCHVRASTCMKYCIEIVKGRWTSLRKDRVLHYAL